MSIPDSMFQYYIKFYGEYSGDTYDILRPNYNVVNNTPALIYSGLNYRVDPTSTQFAEPKLVNIEWYEIFGDRSLLQPGDILRKTTPDGGQTPPVTFGHSMPLKAAIGFRSSRTCTLSNTTGDDLYTNVYYDFIGIGYPGSSINKHLEKSLEIPSTRVVIFKRKNLIKLRTLLIETDSTATVSIDGGPLTQYKRTWMVEEIDQTGNYQVLTLRFMVE